MIDAEHMRRAHVPAGFFERLANGTFNQGFAALPVTGRLVEQGRAVDALLDDQEAAVAFDNTGDDDMWHAAVARSEEHTSELQSLMRISYAVFCLKKQTNTSR